MSASWKKKLSTPIDVLCKGFPNEFVTMLTYCRNLRFEDKPDYSYLRNLLKDLFTKSGFELDYQFDWNLISKDKFDGVKKPDIEVIDDSKPDERREEEKAIEKDVGKNQLSSRPQTNEGTNDPTITDTKKGGLSSFTKEKTLATKNSAPTQPNNNNTNQISSSFQPYQGPKIVVTKQK